MIRQIFEFVLVGNILLVLINTLLFILGCLQNEMGAIEGCICNYVEASFAEVAEFHAAAKFFREVVQHDWIKNSDLTLYTETHQVLTWMGSKSISNKRENLDPTSC